MLALISSLVNNKYFIRILATILIVIGIIFVGRFLYTSTYNKGRDAGIIYQTNIFNKQQDEAKALLDKEQKEADKNRTTLNNEIQDLKDKNSALLASLDKKYSIQQQKVTDYAKTKSGSASCFDSNDDGLRIINESFPDSN